MKTISTLLDIYLVLFLIAIAILLFRCSAPPTPNQNVDDYQNDTGRIVIVHGDTAATKFNIHNNDSITIVTIDSAKGGFYGVHYRDTFGDGNFHGIFQKGKTKTNIK